MDVQQTLAHSVHSQEKKLPLTPVQQTLGHRRQTHGNEKKKRFATYIIIIVIIYA